VFRLFGCQNRNLLCSSAWNWTSIDAIENNCLLWHGRGARNEEAALALKNRYPREELGRRLL